MSVLQIAVIAGAAVLATLAVFATWDVKRTPIPAPPEAVEMRRISAEHPSASKQVAVSHLAAAIIAVNQASAALVAVDRSDVAAYADAVVELVATNIVIADAFGNLLGVALYGSPE